MSPCSIFYRIFFLFFVFIISFYFFFVHAFIIIQRYGGRIEKKNLFLESYDADWFIFLIDFFNYYWVINKLVSFFIMWRKDCWWWWSLGFPCFLVSRGKNNFCLQHHFEFPRLRKAINLMKTQRLIGIELGFQFFFLLSTTLYGVYLTFFYYSHPKNFPSNSLL